ncbi:hypothetical protein JCM10212_004878 [Sporobolomyces blumeae]
MLFAAVLVSLLASSSLALPTPVVPAPRSVFRVLASMDGEGRNNTAAAMPQAPPLPALASSSSTDSTDSTLAQAPMPQSQQVSFESCPVPEGGSSPAGIVHNITVTPCSRSNAWEPCHFHSGENYTIEVSYTSYLTAELPRSGLQARDDTTDPSTSYPYSGQAFDACAYTDCPIQAGKTSTYQYTLETLLSPFNYLTFNVTQHVDGPSLFCAGFEAQFVSDDKPEKKQKIKNPKKPQDQESSLLSPDY